MAGTLNTPGFSLTPQPEQVALPGNYIEDFDFLSQYLPDTYESEFERYGNRTVASLLRRVGAEMPTNSDLIKWSEQGRLHIKYTNVTVGGSAADDTATLTIADVGITAAAVRPGQTVMISDNTASSTLTNKGIVTAVSGLTFDVAFYEAGGAAAYLGAVSVFVYGSEFKKGTNGMQGSLEAQPDIYENSPINIKDNYTVAGGDMAQIGWVEVTTENGASGYLWYIKSEHETRLRFEDYLETSMIEAVPAEAGSGAIAVTGDLGNKGSDGFFYVIEDRGQVWSGGNPTSLPEFDQVIVRMDKNGAIEENVIYNNRNFGFDIDDMLADQSTTTGASYGLFDNDPNMALNLCFDGFRRGYDFYKSDWKYLNDVQMRGGLIGGAVNGALIPAGSTSVYDEVLGKNAKRPFLHVRYKASQTTDRKFQTWVTGSQGGAKTSDLDAMEVHYLSERALCTLGANNFFLFTD
jgi:hypothetical protein